MKIQRSLAQSFRCHYAIFCAQQQRLLACQFCSWNCYKYFGSSAVFFFKMGSASSKFRKHIFNGDEYAAMHVMEKFYAIYLEALCNIYLLQVFQNSPELRKSFDPNSSYGEQLQHNTAIHIVAKHGMKHLLRSVLFFSTIKIIFF